VISVGARQEMRDKRIQQFEADNYQEEQEFTQIDDAYIENDEEGGG
jgi:hypothetical protein